MRDLETRRAGAWAASVPGEKVTALFEHSDTFPALEKQKERKKQTYGRM